MVPAARPVRVPPLPDRRPRRRLRSGHRQRPAPAGAQGHDLGGRDAHGARAAHRRPAGEGRSRRPRAAAPRRPRTRPDGGGRHHPGPGGGGPHQAGVLHLPRAPVGAGAFRAVSGRAESTRAFRRGGLCDSWDSGTGRRRQWIGEAGSPTARICASGCWRRWMEAWRCTRPRPCSGSACPTSTRRWGGVGGRARPARGPARAVPGASSPLWTTRRGRGWRPSRGRRSSSRAAGSWPSTGCPSARVAFGRRWTGWN